MTHPYSLHFYWPKITATQSKQMVRMIYEGVKVVLLPDEVHDYDGDLLPIIGRTTAVMFTSADEVVVSVVLFPCALSLSIMEPVEYDYYIDYTRISFRVSKVTTTGEPKGRLDKVWICLVIPSLRRAHLEYKLSV